MLKFKIGISLLAFSLVSNLVGMDPKETNLPHFQKQVLEWGVKLYMPQETKENSLLEPLNQLLSNGESPEYNDDLWKKLTGNSIISFILNELAERKLALITKLSTKKRLVNKLFSFFKNEKVKNAFLEALLVKKEDIEKKNENALYFSIAQDVEKLSVEGGTWSADNKKIETICKEIAIFEPLSQIPLNVFQTTKSLPVSCNALCNFLTSQLKRLLNEREKKIVDFLDKKFNNYSALNEVFLKNPKGGTPSLEDVQIFITTVSEPQTWKESPKKLLTKMRKSRDNLFLNIVNTLSEQKENNVRELYSVFTALDKVKERETGGQKNAKRIFRTAAVKKTAATQKAVGDGIYEEYMKNLIINLSFAEDFIDTDLVKLYKQKNKKLSYDDVILFFNVRKEVKKTKLKDRKEYIKTRAYLADKLDDSLFEKEEYVCLIYKYCVASDRSKENKKTLYFQSLAKKTINDFYKAKKELLLSDSRLNNLNALFSECSPKEEYKLLSNVKNNALIFSGESDDNELFKYIKDFADSEGQKVSAVSQFLKLKDVAQAVGVDYSGVLSDLYIICVAKTVSSEKALSDIKLNGFDSGKNFVESILSKLEQESDEKKLEYIQKSNLYEAREFSTLKTISDKNKEIYHFDFKKYLNAVYKAAIYSDLELQNKDEKAKLEASFTYEIEELKRNLREKCHFTFQSSKIKDLKIKDLKLIESPIENLKTVDDIRPVEWTFDEIKQQLGKFLNLVKNYTPKEEGVKPLPDNEFSSLDLLALYNECVVYKNDFDSALRQKIENLVKYLNKVLSDKTFVGLKKLLERMLGSCNRDLTIDNKLNLIKQFLTLCTSVKDNVSRLKTSKLLSHPKKHFLSPNQSVERIKRIDIFDETCNDEVTMITNFAGENLCKSMKNLWNKLSEIKANRVYFHEALPPDCLGFRVVREYTIDRDCLREYISESYFINAKLKDNKVSITEYELTDNVIIRTVEQVGVEQSLDGSLNNNITVVPVTFFFVMNDSVNELRPSLSPLATDLEKKLNTDQEENSYQPSEENPMPQQLGLNPNAEPFVPKNKALNPNANLFISKNPNAEPFVSKNSWNYYQSPLVVYVPVWQPHYLQLQLQQPGA